MGESQSSQTARVEIAASRAKERVAQADIAQAKANAAFNAAKVAMAQAEADVAKAKVDGEVERKRLDVQQAQLALKTKEEELKKAKHDADLKHKQREQEVQLALKKAESDASIALQQRLAAEEKERQAELQRVKIEQEKLQGQAKLDHELRLQDIEAEAAKRKKEMLQEAEELMLQEAKNKELMLQPAHVEDTLKNKTAQTFAEFEPLEGASVKKSDHVAVLSYHELQNKEKIIAQTKTLFAELPPEPKQQLMEAAENVVKVITDCVEMHAASDFRKNEFTVQVPQVNKQITTRYCVCFNFSKMDEEIAKKTGLMSWFQGKSVQERTLVGIGYKLEMVTSKLDADGLGQEESATLMELGFF